MPSLKAEDKSNRLVIPGTTEHRDRSILLLIIAFVGLIVSLASGFQDHIPFLKSLCASSCSDAEEIHFLGLSWSFLGVLFYAVVAVLALFKADCAVWIVGPAVGVEAVLVWTLIQLKIPCVFCIANAVVILALLAVTFRKRFFWQEATLVLLFFICFHFWVPYENNLARHVSSAGGTVPSGARIEDNEGIAAKVGNDVITNQRLDVLLGSKLLETRRDIYRMKKDKLEQLIIEKLIDLEAKQQGKTPEELIDQAVPAGLFQIDDADIDKYLQDNQDRLKDFKGSPEELRQRLRAFMEQQKRAQAIKDYAYSLEGKIGVQILLAPPNPPRVKVDTQGAPSVGPSNAPVTIVEFSDFECPACRSTHEVVKQAMAIYGDKIQWIYKDYPLRRHKDAFKAAEAFHCAQDQGKFSEYREKLFTAPDLSPASLVQIAVELGMSGEKFSECLNDSRYKALVDKNIQDAIQAGVDRTPSFMINGIVHAGGPSLDNLKVLINDELKKAGVELQASEKTK